MSDLSPLWMAARRKLSVAEYHSDRLAELRNFDSSPDGVPPIEIQAHFEGVIISLMAAVDQVAQAVNSALRLGLNNSNLISGAFERISQFVPETADWYGNPLGRDLRKLRTRMVHYSYQKSPSAQGWHVENANPAYKGSREIIAYAREAVRYGRELAELVEDFENRLRPHS